MASYQADFKNVRSQRTKKTRKIPFGRFVLLGLIIWFLLKSFGSFQNESPAPKKENKVQANPVGFKVFRLKNDLRQVSISLRQISLNHLDSTLLNTIGIASAELLQSLVVQNDSAEVLDLFFRDSVSVKNNSKAVDLFPELPVVYRIQFDSVQSQMVWRFQKDSIRYWLNESGCDVSFPCLQSPLAGAAIHLDSSFDFQGREKLLYHDQVPGLGESPVRSMMAGEVIDVGSDSTGDYLVVAGKANIQAGFFGLGRLHPNIDLGTNVRQGQELGRLHPRDSTYLWLQMLWNGRFIRMEQMMKMSHPVSTDQFSKFRESLRF